MENLIGTKFQDFRIFKQTQIDNETFVLGFNSKSLSWVISKVCFANGNIGLYEQEIINCDNIDNIVYYETKAITHYLNRISCYLNSKISYYENKLTYLIKNEIY